MLSKMYSDIILFYDLPIFKIILKWHKVLGNSAQWFGPRIVT